MRHLWALLVVVLLACGCVTNGPAISKSSMGNLEINIHTPDMRPLHNASIYLDDVFIGNVSKTMPVIYVKRGERLVRVECPGFQRYERTITILGEPNHQVLNVVLRQNP